jgi:hypothetical protein
VGVNPLDTWIEQVADRLVLDRSLIDRDAILDLTKDVAHSVARPAAPITAYLVGLAVGAGGGTPGDIAAQVRELVAGWQ